MGLYVSLGYVRLAYVRLKCILFCEYRACAISTLPWATHGFICRSGTLFPSQQCGGGGGTEWFQ